MGIIFLTQMENTNAVVKKSTSTKSNRANKKTSKKPRKARAPKGNTYENVIIEGLSKLNERGGVTYQSIIKYMKDQHEMENKHAFKKAIKKLKDNDKVKEGKNQKWLKLTFDPNNTDKDKAKKQKQKENDKKKKDADKKKAADKKKKDADKKKAADKKKKEADKKKKNKTTTKAKAKDTKKAKTTQKK